jgi:hypothetical protein
MVEAPQSDGASTERAPPGIAPPYDGRKLNSALNPSRW